MRALIAPALLLLVACGGPRSEDADRVAQPEERIIGAAGGTLVTTNGLRISIPAGALPADVLITVTAVGSVPGGGFGAVEIGPTGTQFAKPVTLSFNYPAAAASGTLMKVCTVVDGHWRALTGRRENAVTHLVLGQTTHLSPYAAVASTEQCGNGLDDDGDGLTDCGDPACLHDIACASSCDSDSQCDVNEKCVVASCRYTAPAGGTADASTEHLPCNTDVDCGGGEFVCRADLGYLCARPLPVQPDGGVDAGTVDGGTSCYYDRDCASGQVCAANSCVGAPADGGPVDGGTSCEVDSDCGSGLVCQDYLCLEASDGGYPDGGFSDGGSSAVDGGSPDGGSSCLSDSDCPTSHYCYSGVCY